MASTLDVAPERPSFATPAAPALQITLPQSPVGIDTVPVAYDTIFTWDYSVQRVDLRNLYEKSKDSMWNARTYLPWDTDVDPEAELTPNQMSPIWGTPLWDKL